MAGILTGKVALVTGAARGIGAAIADAYEHEGATVFRGDIAPGNLMLDVSDRSVVADVFKQIGPLDILVNNAGLLCTGPGEKTNGAEWDRLVAVNLTGVFNCVQAAIPPMAGRHGAAIVNIASVSAEKGGGR